MEQSWTVDRYDVPVGDLEFWAIRRGKLPQAANRNGRGRRGRVLTHASLAIMAAVAVCIALG
ncbi:MAG: hypothetical protein KF810_02615 [Rhizobiaceae bacterium]|nr:hypothetical protein [Rhizobiaceae bacterium]